MNFWSQTTASPTLWMRSGFATLQPNFIRYDIPFKKPLPYEWIIHTIDRSYKDELIHFLETHYGGDQWIMKNISEWIDSYFIDLDIVIMCAFDKYKNMIGSIFSVPFTKGRTFMSHGASIYNVHVIEGLCVHKGYRNLGLAGYMIHYMDCLTHTMWGPTVHLWSREEFTSSWFTSALCSDQYAYIHCEQATEERDIHPMSYKAFDTLWRHSCIFWLMHHAPCIVAELPAHNRKNDIHIWIGQDNELMYIVAIQNTRREYLSTPFFEVVWSGKLQNGRLDPSNVSCSFLTSVASRYRGILFATDKNCEVWHKPWIYGTSGVHTTYMYNFVPPAFGTCNVYAIRDEL